MKTITKWTKRLHRLEESRAKKNSANGQKDTAERSAEHPTVTNNQKSSQNENKYPFFNVETNTIEYSNDPEHCTIVHYNKKQETNYGKKPTRVELILSTAFGKPDCDKTFNTEKVLYHVMAPVCKSGYLDPASLQALFNTNHLISNFLTTMAKAATIDFTDLQDKKRLDRSDEELLSDIHKHTACALYYDLHMGSVMRYMKQSTTFEHIDVPALLDFVKPIVPEEYYNDLKNTMIGGSPAKINAEMTHQNFQDYIKYGNHSSFDLDKTKVRKSLLKELRHNYIFTLPFWLPWFVPDAHNTPQGLIQRLFKKDRLVFDASFMIYWYSQYINQFTNLANEPAIHFQDTWINFLTWLWNLRISYPDRDILTWADDIAAAFKQCKMNPEIIQGFMYRIGTYACVSIANNFGTRFAPSQFESIARVREILAEHFQQDTSIIEKYKDKLDAIPYDLTPYNPKTLVQATADKLNPGVFNEDGSRKPTPQFMFVDDACIGDTYPEIKLPGAASMHSCYKILGDPEPEYRPDPVSNEKLEEMFCSHKSIRLGYLLNTRTMTYQRDPEKLTILHKQINSQFHTARKRASLLEIAQITGKLQDMSHYLIWVKVLYQNIFTSMLKARRDNEVDLHKNKKFDDYFKQAAYKGEDPLLTAQARFANSKIQKAIWQSKRKHNLPTNFYRDIELIKEFLTVSNKNWRVPIAHVVKRIPEFEAHSDASLTSCGGCSISLRFWWYLSFTDTLRKRTLKYRRWIYNEDGKLISINLFEYLAIIVTYAAALFILTTDSTIKLSHQYPILAAFADNISAVKWAYNACHAGDIGKALSRIFAALTYGSPLGCQPHYIEGVLNKSADAVSRFDNKTDIFSQFHKLSQEIPELKSCRHLRVSNEFCSILTQALLDPTAMTLQLTQLEITELFVLDNDSSSPGVIG